MKTNKLKIGDKVILKSDSASKLYDGVQMYKDQYKEIHQKSIEGKITNLVEKYDHYSSGWYAFVVWDNGSDSNWIHVSWLKNV